MSPDLFQSLITSLLFLVLLVCVLHITNRWFVRLGEILFRRIPGKTDDALLPLLRFPFLITLATLGVWQIMLPVFEHFHTGYPVNRVVSSLLVFVWSFAGAQVLSASLKLMSVQRGAKQHHLADILPFVDGVIRVTALGLSLFIVLSMWGVNVTPILASAGVAGVAVAFAAKDTIANMFGGLSLFFDQAYKVGDYIIVDEKQRGEVVHIGLRSTRIRTRDNVYLTIPNALLAASKVVNETGDDEQLRVRARVTVAYGTDTHALERTLLAIARRNEEVLLHPEPIVRLRELGDNGMQYELLVWMKEPEWKGRLLHELYTDIVHSFTKEGIVIPYPQLVLHTNDTHHRTH